MKSSVCHYHHIIRTSAVKFNASISISIEMYLVFLMTPHKVHGGVDGKKHTLILSVNVIKAYSPDHADIKVLQKTLNNSYPFLYSNGYTKLYKILKPHFSSSGMKSVLDLRKQTPDSITEVYIYIFLKGGHPLCLSTYSSSSSLD
jgi:hypothetical protein